MFYINYRNAKRKKDAKQGKAGASGGKKKKGGAVVKRGGIHKYHCDYCQKDLSTSLRIKCNECDDFDLCLECFSVGAQVTPHKNTHAYRVVDSLSFPVYTMGWGADEETLLLEGVEHFGLGNWPQIASHVGRSAEDCKEHYFRVYIETDCFPQPQKSEELRSPHAVEDIKNLIEEKRRAGARKIAAMKSGVKLEDEDVLAPGEQGADAEKDSDSNLQDKTVEVKEHPTATTGTKTPHSNTVGSPADGTPVVALAESQHSGYHAKRNEFEIEYDHEAENLIAELDFADDDTEEEQAEKLKLIEIYNKRLDERERRKAFVLSRGLVKVKRQQLIDRRRTNSEKDLLGKLRVLARYMPHPQWEALSDGLTIEGRLRARIQELKEYRSMGMRTFEEVDAYVESAGPGKKEPSINNQPGRSKLQRILIDNFALETEIQKMDTPHATRLVHDKNCMIPEGKGVNGVQVWRAKRGILLDVTSLPDSEPLTQEERRLCATERYLPAQYLAVKASMMKKQEEEGFVTKKDILSLPFAVDEERSLRLLEFFKQSNWVKLNKK